MREKYTDSTLDHIFFKYDGEVQKLSEELNELASNFGKLFVLVNAIRDSVNTQIDMFNKS